MAFSFAHPPPVKNVQGVFAPSGCILNIVHYIQGTDYSFNLASSSTLRKEEATRSRHHYTIEKETAGGIDRWRGFSTNVSVTTLALSSSCFMNK